MFSSRHTGTCSWLQAGTKRLLSESCVNRVRWAWLYGFLLPFRPSGVSSERENPKCLEGMEASSLGLQSECKSHHKSVPLN